MAVTITKPEINVREKLKELDSARPQYREVTFTFDGDGSQTDFVLTSGYAPIQVYNDGAIQKEGSGDDYTVSTDGFLNTVSFAVAPGSGNDVLIICVQEDYSS